MITEKIVATLAPPPSFTLDGAQFRVSDFNIQPQYLAMVFIALLARRGNMDAQEFLEAFRVQIKDNNGNVFWPIPTTKEPT